MSVSGVCRSSRKPATAHTRSTPSVAMAIAVRWSRSRRCVAVVALATLETSRTAERKTRCGTRALSSQARTPTGAAPAGSVPERELGVLAHLLRRPRRHEDHLGVDRPDPVQFTDELLDLFCHLRADRTARSGQRERDG